MATAVLSVLVASYVNDLSQRNNALFKAQSRNPVHLKQAAWFEGSTISHTHTLSHTHLYTYTYTHTRTHTHIHTHRHRHTHKHMITEIHNLAFNLIFQAMSKTDSVGSCIVSMEPGSIAWLALYILSGGQDTHN